MTVTGQGDVTGVDDAAAGFLVRGMENKRKMKPEAGYDIQEKE